MKQFWVIAAVQLRGLLATLVGSRRKPRAAVPLLAGVAAVLAFIGGVYAFSIADLLGPDADLVLVLVPALGLLGAIALGGQGVAGFTFGGRDMDLLLSLPVPRLVLALAKLVAVLAEGGLVMLVMVGSAGAAYAVRAPTPPGFWPVLVVAALLLALASTTLSILVGLALVVLRTGRRAIAANLAGLGLVTLLVVAMAVGQNVLAAQLAADPGALRQALSTWLAPLVWLRDAAVDASWPALALLFVVCVAPFTAMTAVVARALLPITSAVSSRRGPVRRVDLSGLRPRTPFAALLRREGQRFLASSVYLLNCGIGAVLTLVAAGALAVVGVPAEFRAGIESLGGAPVLLFALGLGFLGSMSLTTPASVSLEGDRLWILKSAPVPAATVLAAKLAFGVLVPVVPLVVAAAVVARVLGLGWVLGGLVFLLPAALVVVAAEVGLLAGLRWARLDAPSEAAVVKQGTAVMATTLGTFVLVAVVAVLGVSLSAALGAAGAMGIVTGVLALVAVGLLRVVRTRGVRAFAALA